jgi:chemotaxis protein MotB
MAGKKKKQEEAPAGAPLWIVTFSDLMSLLLTFFVLLLSFSSIQEVEFQKALGSLKGALGVLPRQDAIFTPINTKFPRTVMDQKKRFAKAAEELQEAMQALAAQLNEALEKGSIGDLGDKEGDLGEAEAGLAELLDELRNLYGGDLMEMIEVRAGKNGMMIRIDAPLLFRSGTAELQPFAYPILDAIIGAIANWPNNIRIEGHTDDIPIHTPQYPSNWELSTARALNVLKYFEASKKIDPTRLSALGYGEHHPLVPNNSPKNRAKNRRVEIYVEPPQIRSEFDVSYKDRKKR